jgi:hypothetical protein
VTAISTSGFNQSLDDGGNRVLTAVAPEPTTADNVEITSGGEALVLTTESGDRREANASILAQHTVAPDPYEPSQFDLEVRYIGRARGELAQPCRLDRLEVHKEYQAVPRRDEQAPVQES